MMFGGLILRHICNSDLAGLCNLIQDVFSFYILSLTLVDK